MYLEGKVWKQDKHWLIEIVDLDLMTQGKTKKDAYLMLKDALNLLVNQKRFRVKINHQQSDRFFVETANETELLALILKRQRIKYHLSLSDMAKKLHVRSKNAYAQYEQGRAQPSLSKIQHFLSAMNAQLKLSLHLVEV